MDKTSVQMEKDMVADLDAIAEKRGMTRSQIIRLANKNLIEESRKKGEIK